MNAVLTRTDLLWQRAKPLTGVPAHDEVVAGIDPSLTATGFAVIRQGRMYGFVTAPDEKMGLTGVARLDWFYTEIMALMARYRPAMVAVEGYAHGSKFGREKAGELGGVIRLALRHSKVQSFDVQPSTLKSFATGKGGSEKSQVAKELFRRWGVDLDSNDATDAAGLALIAFQRLHKGLALTKAQGAALTKLWS